MPRTKNNRPAKQKRLIATRLMQISLLVDDYVYQHKPMSEESAVVYIKEIATYKDKCNKDARSLQVIDKLTRCITAIIHEQQELHGAGEEEINAPQDKVKETNDFPVPYKAQENDNNIMSPVYSEIDEDLTQMPQYFEVVNYIGQTARYIANDLDNTIDYNNQAEIVPLCVNEIEPDSTINGVQNRDVAGISVGMESVSEVINLCDEDIDELIRNHASFRHEPEFNIQKAISNLSIRDIDENFTPCPQQYSQSILDNLNAQNITYQPQDTMVPPSNNDDFIKATAILQNPRREMVSFRHGPTKIVLPTSNKLKNQANINKTAIKCAEKIQKKGTVCSITTAPKNQKQTKRNYRKAVNACEINAKDGTEIKAPKNQKQTKRNYRKAVNACEINAKDGTEIKTKKCNAKTTHKKLQENKDLSIKEKPLPKVYTDKNKPRIQGHQKNTNMKTSAYQNIQTTASANTNIKSHDISENAVTPIQNKIKTFYDQNLSWVENLRFVREIQVEEFEPFNDEGFWENCDLPAKFNEEDFNY